MPDDSFQKAETSELEQLLETGPWPFVTRRVFKNAANATRIWNSRIERKSLKTGSKSKQEEPLLWGSIWGPHRLNWWIGVVFAAGSLLFAIGSLLSLLPSLAEHWNLRPREINAIFFAGSIPFSTAAWLQLFQAANAGEPDESQKRKTRLIGWRPHDIGWLSCALQFVGTLLFNVNTLDATIPTFDWIQQDYFVWVPDLIGSILFLVSGYLAFIETCHSHWAWKPDEISWWVVFVNLLGCVGFMISAIFAFSFPVERPADELISTAFTLCGAIGFLLGSLLMLPESAIVHEA